MRGIHSSWLQFNDIPNPNWNRKDNRTNYLSNSQGWSYKSRKWSCLVAWFCYHLIAGAPSWPVSQIRAPQSLATNSPAPGPRPLTCGVSSECLGTRSYETTSRDQLGKIEMFFNSTGACTAIKSPIANHRSSIVAQLYFASVTQMFLVPLFVKVESGSSKLLRTVSKSGPNGCKERSRPQKMSMRIKIESFLGRQNLVLTVTHSHKQPREEQNMIVTWTALIIITKFFLNPPTWL